MDHRSQPREGTPVAVIHDLWNITTNQTRHRGTRAWTAARQAAVYGWAAPTRNEAIHVDPRHIRAVVTSRAQRHLERVTGHQGGVVVGGDWDVDLVNRRDFRTKLVYRSCHAHWVDGVPWEDTELIRIYRERLARGECRDFDGIEALMARYARLDRVFQEASERRTLSRRYEDLVRISIARDHTLLWGPDGRHRVTIALILGLERIPARVGFIHARALPYFQTLRTPHPSGRRWFVLPGARGTVPLVPPPPIDRRGAPVEPDARGSADRVA
jgi:hypothetical protein